MDEDGSAEGGRTRLARGTKPNPAVGEHEHDGANADAAVPAATAPRGGDDARVRTALLTAPARAGSLPASPGTTRRAARPSGAPEPGAALSGAGRAPAQSICEAVEQLIEAQEADDAIAEWMRGGG